MATYDFGKIGISLGGDYNSASTYERYTKVRHNNASWISKKSVPVNTPPSAQNSEYWMFEVQDGATGPAPIKQIASYTLLASGWTGNASPYEYDLSEDLETILGTEYDEDLRVDVYFDEENATDAQKEDILVYNIFGSGEQSVFAHCTTIPAINIPVILTWYV